MQFKIGLIGDFNESVTAHRAINECFQLAKSVDGIWVGTHEVSTKVLAGLDGLWCAPASPYRDTAGALEAIRYARESSIPFLGSCGGYQHAVLEYTHNVLGFPQAGNLETDPDCEMPLVAGLRCALVDRSDPISIRPESRLATLMKSSQSVEEYRCSYGINPDYLHLFAGTDLTFSAVDNSGEPRALELSGHPFFLGTAFQPERLALSGLLHPIVEAFFDAVRLRADRQTQSDSRITTAG